MYLGSWDIDDYLTFPLNAHRADTGAAADPAGNPAYRIYEDETGTPIVTGNMAKLDDANTLGFYSERVQLTAANGFETGKTYTIYMAATVNSVLGTNSHTFQMGAKVVASSLGAQAKLDVNAEVDTALDTAIPGGPTANSINERVKAIDDKLPSGTISDFDETSNDVNLVADQSGVTIGTVNAVAAGVIAAIWDNLTSGLTQAGSIGKLLVDNVNAAISSRSSHSAADVWTSGTRTLSSFGSLIADIWSAGTRSITGFTAAAKSEINAEVDDVITTDAQSEESQGIPPAAPTIKQMMMYIYMKWRNEYDQTATLASVKNNAGTTICKATVSDDNTTYQKEKYISGA